MRKFWPKAWLTSPVSIKIMNNFRLIYSFGMNPVSDSFSNTEQKMKGFMDFMNDTIPVTVLNYSKRFSYLG